MKSSVWQTIGITLAVLAGVAGLALFCFVVIAFVALSQMESTK